MRKILLTGIAMMTIAISSCDDQTYLTGNSLTAGVDRFSIETDTFDVKTKSVLAGSVISRSMYTYLGRIKDPETGSYITSDYTTAFSLLENEAAYVFANEDYIANKDSLGIVADSCYLSVFVNSFQGDSLAAMKLNVHELAKPIGESRTYYSDFDPEQEGYLRSDANSINENVMYSMSDLTLSDSLRKKQQSNSYYQCIHIPLNKVYIDKEGCRYSNYGTYVMKQYYEHPEYFKNYQTFVRKVCPGFYFKTADGLGVMSEIYRTQLNIDYTYELDGEKNEGTKTFNSTPEVMQTTHISNDPASIRDLAEKDTTFTYLKTPAGIFTEVELPVDDIKQGHEKDSITLAEVVFTRLNDNSQLTDDMLEEPENLLLIQKDSLGKFFMNRDLTDNILTYIASYNSIMKTYTFSNIAHLVNAMYKNKGLSENWNKAVLVPVETTMAATSSSASASTVVSIANEMNVNSVRLVRGCTTDGKHSDIRISIIYNKNE